MSSINILHDIRNLSIKNGKKVVEEEYVIQGDKGLKIKYYYKDDKKKEKITITGKDGKYMMKSIVDDKVDEKELDEKGLKAEMKNSKLKFAKEQLGGTIGATSAAKVNDLEGGAKKRSKSGSKKSGSKKAGSKKKGYKY
jgi:hypothetical protein